MDSSPRLVVQAPAKLNLYLEILGKRPDDFHELRTLMVAIDLFDELVLEDAAPGVLELTCDRPELSTGPENLVLRAAKLLLEECGESRGAQIHLTKRIPWAAGLGGGSSDAATTLSGLNELWQLKMSRAELATLGAKIGSDVPFFFHTPAAWCEGRGEKVTAMELPRQLDFVLVCPASGLSTRDVFRELNASRFEDCGDELPELRLDDLQALAKELRNDLQAPAIRLSPAVKHWIERLGRTEVLASLMSGSGSSLFALCRDEREAQRVAERLRSETPSDGSESARIFAVRTCT